MEAEGRVTRGRDHEPGDAAASGRWKTRKWVLFSLQEEHGPADTVVSDF